jgi:hypothetical protein
MVLPANKCYHFKFVLRFPSHEDWFWLILKSTITFRLLFPSTAPQDQAGATAATTTNNQTTLTGWIEKVS